MSRVRHLQQQLVVLFLYGLVSLGATWPLVRDFRTWPVGDIVWDQQHSLWMLWHVKEAVLWRQPWFSADLLFYPHGISTLGDGVGPVTGILGLPFWPWGVVAAYNGATLLGLVLSGWSMYLLVRYGAGHTETPMGLALRPWAAWFAGLVFMLWPIHLVGMYGHIEKIFVGALPLAVLAGLLAWDPARSRWWLAAPGVALLLALLQNGQQFLFAVLALVLLGIGAALASWRRAALLAVSTRIVGAGVLSIVIVGPMLSMIAKVARDPTMQVAVSGASFGYSPDVLQMVLPSIHQRVGRVIYPAYDTIAREYTRTSILPALNLNPWENIQWVGSGVETAATVPYTVLGLLLVAALARLGRTRVWWWFSGLFVVLALGPMLRFAGQAVFTDFRLPMILPYAWLVSAPGFNMMRTPGRFMMIAAVGLTVLAATSLTWLALRAPRYARVTCVVVSLLVLIECWPNAWPQQVPPPLPAFYAGLAADPERCAVLDLPVGASAYMYYQTFHGKGIAWGYLSRMFKAHPVSAVRALSEPNMTEGLAAETRAQFASMGYCYVVWHKYPEIHWPHRAQNGERRFGAPTDPQSDPFIRAAFAGEVPIVDDKFVTVYRMGGGARQTTGATPAAPAAAPTPTRGDRPE